MAVLILMPNQGVQETLPTMRAATRQYLDFDDDDSASQPRSTRGKKPRLDAQEVWATAAEREPGVEGGFNPSFSSSRHERAWILSYLTRFYDDHLITDVLHQVKGGKEATVYCCAAHPSTGVDLIAAKVYRPRTFRQLRNDVQYRQGRRILDDQGKRVTDDRMLHAVAKGTAFGKHLSHVSWLAHEYGTLQVLHAAGADVPRPWAIGENAILMQYLGGVGLPAPSLHETRLDRRAARQLFDRLMVNVELMLRHGRVHGDLSAFNVLYWEGEATLIDFPQAVDVTTNSDARALFERDVLRLCQYFERYDVRVDARALAHQMWQRYRVEDNFEAMNLLAMEDSA